MSDTYEDLLTEMADLAARLQDVRTRLAALEKARRRKRFDVIKGGAAAVVGAPVAAAEWLAHEAQAHPKPAVAVSAVAVGGAVLTAFLLPQYPHRSPPTIALPAPHSATAPATPTTRPTSPVPLPPPVPPPAAVIPAPDVSLAAYRQSPALPPYHVPPGTRRVTVPAQPQPPTKDDTSPKPPHEHAPGGPVSTPTPAPSPSCGTGGALLNACVTAKPLLDTCLRVLP